MVLGVKMNIRSHKNLMRATLCLEGRRLDTPSVKPQNKSSRRQFPCHCRAASTTPAASRDDGRLRDVPLEFGRLCPQRSEDCRERRLGGEEEVPRGGEDAQARLRGNCCHGDENTEGGVAGGRGV